MLRLQQIATISPTHVTTLQTVPGFNSAKLQRNIPIRIDCQVAQGTLKLGCDQKWDGDVGPREFRLEDVRRGDMRGWDSETLGRGTLKRWGSRT